MGPGATMVPPNPYCPTFKRFRFRYRIGSGKWPEYYIDSLPAVVNVGPGSPAGLLFGKSSKFPEKYQKALFGLDWTFGTIYAFHLKPEGASYTAEKEEFISGKPFQLPTQLSERMEPCTLPQADEGSSQASTGYTIPVKKKEIEA